MRALIVPEFGDADVLRWDEVPQPDPQPGEVLVKVRGFPVNWADLLMRSGRYPGGPTPPYIAGFDMVGEIAAYGAGVSSPALGTRVFGVLGQPGTAAEFVAARADLVHPVPVALSDAEAAGAASPYLTSDAALMTLGHLQPGDTVLVQAAAGGIGTACMQMARAYGAGLVIGTAGGPMKAERIRELGADIAVDYLADDFVAATLEATGGRGADVIVDSVGGEVLNSCFDCIAPAGRLVCVGASSGRGSNRLRLQTLFDKDISVSGFTFGHWLQAEPALVEPSVRRVLAAFEAGSLRPVVARVFSPAQIADAHRFLAERLSVGRTVVLF